MTDEAPDILRELQLQFGAEAIAPAPSADGVPTAFVPAERTLEVLAYLRKQTREPFAMLFDLFGIDERQRRQRGGQPHADFTVVYHLLSLGRAGEVRIKVALTGEWPSVDSVTALWPNADWYERELWDMFGIKVRGHANLRRILMPPWWQGHPLRKEHHARATELPPFSLPLEKLVAQEESLEFRPEDWGLARRGDLSEYMFLNLGPHHPGMHGVLRMVLQLDGERIVEAVPDIGFHHRGAEKMGERQTWHKYIPYTDRVDYLSGVLNNFPYVLAVEKLAGIDVPDRAKVIRVMMAELYRIASHLVFYGTFATDLGSMSPVFFMFNDREKVLDITQAVCGARMHANWFRIGGVAQDLPDGWEKLVGDFLDYMPRRIDEYDSMVLRNRIFKARTVGIGEFSLDQATAWGLTGPMLRSTGLAWDVRKKIPYGGYERFDFDVPVGTRGDCYDRALVHAEEMRQSLRIIRQCMENMPAGDYKSRHPLATPPVKDATMRDIETLITHFLQVSWGTVMPAGEACVLTENAKGANSYYLVSDGGTGSYRTRIRTASFPHIQVTPMLSRGATVADLIAILGSVDFVLADVDR